MSDHNEKARERIREAADSLAQDDDGGRDETPAEKKSKSIKETTGE